MLNSGAPQPAENVFLRKHKHIHYKLTTRCHDVIYPLHGCLRALLSVTEFGIFVAALSVGTQKSYMCYFSSVTRESFCMFMSGTCPLR